MDRGNEGDFYRLARHPEAREARLRSAVESEGPLATRREMFTAAASDALAARPSALSAGALRLKRVRNPSVHRASPTRTPAVAMAPFRNPFKKKPEPEGGKGPSGAEVLAKRLLKGREKAKTEGFQSVLADVRDGTMQRNFGNGGSWPEAAEAVRRGVCPLCGADTSKALEAAEASGAKPDAFLIDPVRQAELGRHPLGWCAKCAESNRLLDTTGGF